MSNGNLSFPNDWGTPCPPADANDANETVYRAVIDNPPTADDFKSWMEEGKTPKGGQQAICRAHGVSVMLSLDDALHYLEAFRWAGKRFVAHGTILAHHGKTKRTPGRLFPSHVTWWCYLGVARHSIFSVQ